MTRDEALRLLGLGPHAGSPEIEAAIAREYRLWRTRTNAPAFEARTEAQRRVHLLGEAEKLLLGDRRQRTSTPRPRPAGPTGPVPPTPGWHQPAGTPAPEWGTPELEPSSVPWNSHSTPCGAQGHTPVWETPSAPKPTGGPSWPSSGSEAWPAPATPLPPYYTQAFATFDAGGSKVVWNWAAFLFGALWYLVHGMWGKALAYFLAVLVTGGLLWIPAAIYAGLFGTWDRYLLVRRGTQSWS